MEKQVILNKRHFELTVNRLCYQLIESHNDFSNTVLIGLQPRGVNVVARLKSQLEAILGKEVVCGNLDITFYRDDFRRREKPLIPSATNIDFVIEGKNVVLVDDVLYTGRTIRAGIEGLMEYGRPKSVELLVLIDRKKGREVPIEATYVGKEVESFDNQRVRVMWKSEGEKEDHVIFLND
jgi:pyrimidine operon attenuation protein/uracil phosphoribosyltransferase